MKKMILGAAALAALAAFPAAAQQPDAPMAPRAAHPVTRADFQQRLRAHFAKLDANRDGFVDRAEAEARMAGMRTAMRNGPGGSAPDAPRPPRMRMDRNAMFDSMDANRDGSISRDEFLAFHGRHHAMGAPMAHGDGMTGPTARGDEMRGPMAGPDGARPMRARHAGMRMGFGGRWFDRLDADHDGRVSLAEADRAATAMFDRLDANHDGTITPDERLAARDHMRRGMDERREQ
jgi:Ca2+-binding EF-hand superfamily protein